MARRRLRVALDANVLIAGTVWPRWPHEVMRSALTADFDFVLPEQIVDEVRRHLDSDQQEMLEDFLADSSCERLPLPLESVVVENRDIVRSEKDVPIAIALLGGQVDIFVTNDRDFTEPDATSPNFRARVKVMLPAVFLRDVLDWTAEELEGIRDRNWADLRADSSLL